ncbi:MAG: polyribonucleotide nucleotidyltransferase, partial [Ghiorsea sp.]|nr:polyribonucleotide nucleotidyltransferase [Ghiorsea sp.]
ADDATNPDIIAINGVSAALSISDVPFAEPIAASRVGLIDGEFVLNPTYAEMENSELDLIVAGTRDAVLMIESEAKELSEEKMIDAIIFGQEGYAPVIDAIDALVKDAGKEKLVIELAGNADVQDAVNTAFEADVRDAYATVDKSARSAKIEALRTAAQDKFAGTEENPGQFSSNDVTSAVKNLEKNVVRRSIIDGNPRIDGRKTDDVRAIDCQVGVLPGPHGSALFTRGETQALVTITLGTESDMQTTESLEGVAKQRFMLHYNFPPYSVGEARRMGPPGRREIGHGRLARRGVEAVLPSMEEFGYAIRSVCEITESNGSSSMASVCGSSLAMMNAGVPIKAAVAGIAMGLILEKDGHAVLSDILGDEDHLGDMDFKVAGTTEGVTTLQLDIKIGGLTREIMREALAQANGGRMHILAEMAKCMTKPNADVASHAPRMFTMKIKADKIREVIGAGGKVIRGIVEETGAKVDIADDGTITIFAVTGDAGQAAKKMIQDIVAEVEVGKVYEGKVVKIMDFGAFVRILGQTDGLVHISQIANERVEKVADKLSEGDVVQVKVLEVDRSGKIRLSMKALLEDA